MNGFLDFDGSRVYPKISKATQARLDKWFGLVKDGQAPENITIKLTLVSEDCELYRLTYGDNWRDGSADDE